MSWMISIKKVEVLQYEIDSKDRDYSKGRAMERATAGEAPDKIDPNYPEYSVADEIETS